MNLNDKLFVICSILNLLWGIGYGISLHDYCHSLWEIGGYKEILSLQGGYIGFTINIIVWIIFNYLVVWKERNK